MKNQILIFNYLNAKMDVFALHCWLPLVLGIYCMDIHSIYMSEALSSTKSELLGKIA